MTADPLADFLAEARVRVDAALERWLPKPPACPAIVSEAMRYSVFAGGKRLRPMLTLAAAVAVANRTLAAAAAVENRTAEAVRHERGSGASPLAHGLPPVAHGSTPVAHGSSPVAHGSTPVAHGSSPVAHGSTPVAHGFSRAFDAALPAACAIELIHTYSLIHDDLPAMDDDTLRRGRPTLHVVYGDGIAILAGDGLHAEAFGLLAREPASDDPDISRRKIEVIRLIAEAAGAAGMVGGQAIDLQAAGQAPGHGVTLDADGLRTMHALKTGALIRAAASAGAIMAGGSADMLAAVDEYARAVGLAFQIVDDILDVEGDPASLGKTAGKDAAAAKPTYPALFGLDRARVLAAECLDRAHASLDAAGIGDSFLGGIADWVVSRKS